MEYMACLFKYVFQSTVHVFCQKLTLIVKILVVIYMQVVLKLCFPFYILSNYIKDDEVVGEKSTKFE